MIAASLATEVVCTDPYGPWQLTAAIALGLTAGWNLAIHVWNWQARKARAKPDPIKLNNRPGFTDYDG